jgi:hypothetical protein
LLRFAFAEFSPRRPTLLWRQLDGSDVLRTVAAVYGWTNGIN